jgi:hypothetical protein
MVRTCDVKGSRDHDLNIDMLGNKWVLAPGGREIVNTCHSRIFDLQAELSGLGALFKNSSNCDLSAEELYGIGVLIDRASRRLSRVSSRLLRSIQRYEIHNLSSKRSKRQGAPNEAQ